MDVEKWALQACHGRQRTREEPRAGEEKLGQAQKTVVEAPKAAIDALIVAKELQETVDDLQKRLLEKTNINETLSARLQKFRQPHQEKPELAALKAVVFGRKRKIRELAETVEQYGERLDLLSVESGPKTLLIKRSGQTPTQTESSTPAQQLCSRMSRKLCYSARGIWDMCF